MRWSGRTGSRVLRSTFLCLGVLLALASLYETSYCATEYGAGVAFPRGFFDYAFGAQAEHEMQYRALPPYLTPAVRVSGYFSYLDNLRLAVGSGSILLKLSPRQATRKATVFVPYVSVGPSVNYLYSWADLEDFGNMSESKLSTTLSVFAGAELLVAPRVSLFAEARQTVPSDFTFDYVLVGLKLRASYP
ncbi:MAG: hypothetical protein JSW03_05100 [Candidatus Eiseniibacteriota bacterium]|nr:MAG: hypothetical protein JSW03_05100 [Candidatus Eisenbacteria bacterium]